MTDCLTLTMQKQAQTNWCWAAVTSSVANFLSAENPEGALTQCQIACKVLSVDTCCEDGSSEECNCNSLLEIGLASVGHLNGAPYNGPIAFDSIKAQISAPYRVPIGVRVSNGTQGHFLLIIGFDDDNDNQWVDVSDPLYGEATYALTDFAGAYHGMPWTHSYGIK